MVMNDCTLCPRKCHADRTVSAGYCGCPGELRAARAGLHYFEEPFISGLKGSGTVFFSGCSLGCVYCQNSTISGRDSFGISITPERLAAIFLELQSKGAHNINLVTGTPYIPFIKEALEAVRQDGSLKIPVLWNSGGYERTEALEMLDGLVDIWLPDLKTLSKELSLRYMNAPDYPEAAMSAVSWMAQKAGPAKFVPYGKDTSLPAAEGTTYTQEDVGECGIMVSGVCVRHLVIPGQAEDSLRVLEWLADTFGNDIWISLMSQYTPMRTDFPQEELNRKLTPKEYDRVVDRAVDLGLENVMIQMEDVADDSFIPVFDGTGIVIAE